MSCLGGVCNTDTRRRFTKTPYGKTNAVSIKAKREKGLFLSATVLIGARPYVQFDLGKVSVTLNIDGKLIIPPSGLDNFNWFGYDKQNNSCIKVTHNTGYSYSLTIGYPYPLQFKKSCTLQVLVNDKRAVNLTQEITFGFPE